MPSITDIRIDWMDGFANDPCIFVALSERPRFEAYRKYPCQNGQEAGHLYVAEDHALRDFFYWAKPDDGFGGWDRLVYIDDGSVERLIGGWSSRASVASEVTGVDLVDVYYEVGAKCSDRAAGTRPISVVRSALQAALNRLHPDVTLVMTRPGVFTAKWLGQPSKAEWLAGRTGTPYSQARDGKPLGF